MAPHPISSLPLLHLSSVVLPCNLGKSRFALNFSMGAARPLYAAAWHYVTRSGFHHSW